MIEPLEDSVARFQRTQARDDFETLAKEWLPSIRRFLYVHLGPDLEGCNDVQQEVLIALHREVAGFNGRSQFSTFLYRLVRNKAVDYIRRESRHRRRNLSLEHEVDPSSSPLAGVPDPLDTLVRDDSADRLLWLLWTLPPKDRELIHLREIEGLGEQDCSRILGQPLGTLKSRLHRLKKKLYQQMLEDEGNGRKDS